MHFEVLVEDQSGSIALDILLKRVIGANGQTHSWTLRHYKGIGHIPKKLHQVPNPRTQLLLHHLPALLRGYGRGLSPAQACVVVVVDLDDKDCIAFKQDLVGVLNACNPAPTTLFRIAIEECEAWLLGDRDAVKAAYPNAKDPVLNGYAQDSICGTWEVLADAVHPGGAVQLRKSGWPGTQPQGEAKSEWARQNRSVRGRKPEPVEELPGVARRSEASGRQPDLRTWAVRSGAANSHGRPAGQLLYPGGSFPTIPVHVNAPAGPLTPDP